MKEILRFKYKDVELCLLENNGELVYVKLENGNFFYDVSLEEKEIMNKVLAKLMPSRSICDLGIIKYNAKKFHHFYDLDNHFHLFYEGEDLKLPNSDDILALNQVFNNQEEYFAHNEKISNKDQVRPKKMNIKRILSIGGMTLFVSIASFGLILLYNMVEFEPIKPRIIASEVEVTPRPTMNSNIPLDNRTPEEIASDTQLTHNQEPITLNAINYAIDINPSLSSEEKAFYKTLYKNLADFIPYMHADLVYDLRRVKIVYNPNVESHGLKGYANKPFNEIGIYEASNYSTASMPVLAEEMIHFSNSEMVPTTGNVFYDFLCQRLVSERMPETFPSTNQAFSFSNQTDKYCFTLCELLEPETLWQFTFNSDYNIIIEDLMTIIPGDYNLAYNLLINIDRYNTIVNSCTSDSDIIKWEDELSITRSAIEETLLKYYNAKYTVNGKTNLNALYFIDRSTAIDIIAQDLNLDDKTRMTLQQNPDAITIESPKNIFASNSTMTLNFPTKIEITKKIYHRDQLLTGVDGLKYNSLAEINLPHPTPTDYDHYVYTSDNINYTTYTIPNDYMINMTR